MPVIELSTSDFDADFNLSRKDLLKKKVVLLIHRPTCGHCVHFKPEYFKASENAGSVIFAAIDTDSNPDFMRSLMQSAGAQYKPRGVPTVVSFNNGKYWSTYGANNNKYRTAEDVLEYVAGIGSADISYVDQ
jgi:thioredoxin-like negative regulator of GroEL